MILLNHNFKQKTLNYENLERQKYCYINFIVTKSF